MSGSSASPIVSRSMSFSSSASGSVMPSASLRWRTASGSSVPAAADEPSRLRPKRAPSSSAQSISFSVTFGRLALVAAQHLERRAARRGSRRASRRAGRRRCASRPRRSCRVSPGIVAHRFPATSRSTVASVSSSLPSSHSRALRQSSLHASRRAPSGPPVSSASSCRSLSGRSQSKSGMGWHDRRNSRARAGFFCTHVPLGRSSGSRCLFALLAPGAQAASPYAKATRRALRSRPQRGDVRAGG